LLEALLKLIETNALALTVADKDSREQLGYVTLASINRKISQLRHPLLEATTIETHFK
jgi:hypothetical protein